MDAIDRKLLDIVQLDGRGIYANFGDAVGLSTTAVHGRLKKLAESGVITGWSALVDPVQAGFPVVLLIRIEIDLPSNREAFASAVSRLSHVQECHLTSGRWNCCLKMRAASMAQAESLVAEEISILDGVIGMQIEAVSHTKKETLSLPNAETPL